MPSRRQSRVIQGEKSNINDIDLGPLLSIRSRDKIPFLPMVSQRSTVSAPACDSFVGVAHHRLKTGLSYFASNDRAIFSATRLSSILALSDNDRRCIRESIGSSVEMIQSISISF